MQLFSYSITKSINRRCILHLWSLFKCKSQADKMWSRAVPNSGCVVFGRIRIIDATIRLNTNRIRIVEVRDVKFVVFSKFELWPLKFELNLNFVYKFVKELMMFKLAVKPTGVGSKARTDGPIEWSLQTTNIFRDRLYRGWRGVGEEATYCWWIRLYRCRY